MNRPCWCAGSILRFSPTSMNQNGKVAEGAVSALIMVRDGKVITPPMSADILESITRATVMELCHNELKRDVMERDVDRAELYIADELFFCGTSPEILPILSVDRYQTGDGKVGPLTLQLTELFEKAVRGLDDRYEKWLTSV